MNRTPAGVPTGGQFTATERGEATVDLSGPQPSPTEPRKAIPAPSWGWGYGVQQVDAEVVEEVRGTSTVQAVYADGQHVGYLLGRNESATSKRRWWSYHPGTQVPTTTERAHLVYGNDSRQTTADNLLFAVRDDLAPRADAPLAPPPPTRAAPGRRQRRRRR